MRAPAGVSTLNAITGRAVSVPDDRIISVTEADAKALELAGAGRARLGLVASEVSPCL
jgi:hypothetical protein